LGGGSVRGAHQYHPYEKIALYHTANTPHPLSPRTLGASGTTERGASGDCGPVGRGFLGGLLLWAMFDRLWICWRILFRRCLALIGLGKPKRAEEPLLPVAKARVDPSVAPPAVELGQMCVGVNGSSAGGPPEGGGATGESWDDWGGEFEEAQFKTAEARQAEKIQDLMEELAPKKIKAKKAVSKTLLQQQRESAQQRAASRLRLAVDTPHGAATELGDLEEDPPEDSWGGDDDEIKLADVKAVERAAARRAREKAIEEKRAARHAERNIIRAGGR